MTLYEQLDAKKARDIKVLGNFVAIYCRENHAAADRSAFPFGDERLRGIWNGRELVLCPDCKKLLHHGIAKRLLCPYDPKPMCKKCETHCYAPGYRQKVREVMRFSGTYLVKHGRIDLLLHYYF